MKGDFWAIIGSVLSLFTAGSVTSVGSVSADETSAELGAGGLFECFDTSSLMTGESSAISPHTAEGLTTAPSRAGGFAAGATVVIGTSGITATAVPTCIDMSSNGTEVNIPGVGKVWEDSSGNIHTASNTIPYSRVERRAQRTYDLLHGNPSKEYDFPVAIIETAEALEAFEDVFGKNPSIGKIHESLTVMEMALEQQIYEGNP